MVARLCRLRVALLLSVFRGIPSAVARSVGIGALALVGAIALAFLPQWIVRSTDAHTGIDTVLVSVVLAAAGIVPLFANRKHLEPRHFAQFPANPSQIASGMLVSTFLGWPTLWLVAWWVSLIALRPEWHTAWWAVVVGAVLALLLAVAGARVASAFAKLVVSQRNAGAVRATGLLLLVAALPVVVFAVTQALSSPGGKLTSDAAQVLGWTPVGAPAAGIALAAAGDIEGALLRFGVVLATVFVLVLAWYAIVRVSLERIDRPIDPNVARQGLDWFDRFPAKPGPVIGARALTYWLRDPRYRVALAAIPLAPVFIVVALWVAGVEPHILALVPLPVVLLLLGWSLHNDVAMDSTALWIHVASGTRGRDDRFGRLSPVLLLGLPLVLVGSSITVTVMGDWRVLPAVIGMNLGVLLAAAGVSSVFSAMLPYPTTRPGDSPFAQPAVAGTGSGLAQTLSMLGALVLAVPPIWISFSAIDQISFGMNLWALVFGAGYGLVVVTLGVFIGGRIFDRAAPELLALTQTFD
ncbi:hypothetical protein ACR5KS_00375 [Leucobacter sp. W1153]|uniref:hypothetical protein n=1 Tax=Leucobacter sp. W1153 TaxID=3439064 RepID=UPI003F40CF46